MAPFINRNNGNDDQKEGQRVAVIGGGVSAMAAAWHLHVNSSHDVSLFEAEDRLGGHAYTLQVPDQYQKLIDVDIGFMVFNHSNYPNLLNWFKALSASHPVQDENSDMSFSVSLDDGYTVEWGSDGLSGLFAMKSQVLSPSFYRFFWDMIRFNAQAPHLLQLDQQDPRKHVTMGQYLKDHNYSQDFAAYYLLPMIAAIWSASIEDTLSFPAEQFISFFCNHKLLQLFDRPQWKTVQGRSRQYTQAVEAVLGDAVVHLATPIVAVSQLDSGSYKLYTADMKPIEGIFDQVIFACHPPTASQILQQGEINQDQALLDLLSQVRYEDNSVYVHSDTSLMPRRKAAWTSWNCLGKSQHLQVLHATTKKGESLEGAESGFGNTVTSRQAPNSPEDGRMKAVYVTYWLNRLQNLETTKDIFVSLNPHQKPDPSLTYHCVNLAHPQFTHKTCQARKAIQDFYQGNKGLWFCGAWESHGFHEDGCRSGFSVATKLSGVPLPWASTNKGDGIVLSAPDLSDSGNKSSNWSFLSLVDYLYRTVSYDLPVALCKQFVYSFLERAVTKGSLLLKSNDGSIVSFGDGSTCGCDDHPVTLRIFDDWFFFKVALEYDLGLARSYMAGYFVVEALDGAKEYHPVMRSPDTHDETTTVFGDPVGLTRLFLLLIGNRDHPPAQHVPRKSGRGHSYTNALTTASGLVVSRLGSLLNYLRYKLTMDNSERGGSLKNIHAHYDLSNDLFTSFLDKETLMYSSAIYDSIQAPSQGLVFRGTLEEAQLRKVDTLLARAQIQPGQTLLDIGFGWGFLSIQAAKKFRCRVTGITLSVEQKALAEKRVQAQGLEHLITFEVVDYRKFARRKENLGKFDRVISCEMIEAVGHEHLGEFFWAVEQVLTQDGILVMEAITTPEQRYETYLRSTDFINTVIFPGGCAPSLHSLVDASYRQSCLTLEHIDNIGLHYAHTLREWRRRFNANEDFIKSLGFDDVFLRCWNYYMTYCEAGFFSQTVNCLILVFARQGCSSLAPLCETRSVTQAPPLTKNEVQNWL